MLLWISVATWIQPDYLLGSYFFPRLSVSLLMETQNSKDPVFGIKKLRSEDLEYKCGHLGFGSGNNGTI